MRHVAGDFQLTVELFVGVLDGTVLMGIKSSTCNCPHIVENGSSFFFSMMNDTPVSLDDCFSLSPLRVDSFSPTPFG